MVSVASKKPAEFDPIAEGALRAMVKAFGLLKHIMEPYLARHGLTGAQWGILRALDRAEKEGVMSLRPSELGKRLLVRPPSVTGLIARMQRAGMLVLAASKDDQRVKNVSLAPAGRRLLEQALAGHGAQIEAIVRPLSRKDRLQLRGLLEKLVGRMEELAGGADPGAAVADETEESD